MLNKIQNFGVAFLVILGFGLVGEAYSQNGYCIPPDQRPAGYNAQPCLQIPGTYYPLAKFSKIQILNAGTENVVWEYTIESCDDPTDCYIYVTEEQGLDPVELVAGQDYDVRYYLTYYTRFARNYRHRLYVDADRDVEFEQNNDEYLFQTTRRYNTAINAGLPNYCPQVVRDYGWARFVDPAGGEMVQFTITADGSMVSSEASQIRFMTEYQVGGNNNDPCINGYLQPARFAWQTPSYFPGYGQTIDSDLFVGCEVIPFPGDNDGLFAEEMYDGTTRNNIEYPKPSVTFTHDLQAGDYMIYEILGPLPSTTVVWRATDVSGNHLIDVAPGAAGRAANITMDGTNMIWESAYAPEYDGSNAAFTEDANGIPIVDGRFYASLSGEYLSRISFVDINENPTVCGVEENVFTIRAENDMTVSSIESPRNFDEPFFRKYLYQRLYEISGVYRNIGLNDVNEFVAQADIWCITEECGDWEMSTQYNYDSNNPNETTIEPLQTRDIVFADRFRPPQPGLYSMRLSVVSMEGSTELDQNTFNNYLPRPSGGNADDGWEWNDDATYILQAVYSYDIVASEVIVPLETPTNDEDLILANRPFNPVVRWTNEGLLDATDVECEFIIYDMDDNVVASGSVIADDMPGGRFNATDVIFTEVTITEPGTYRIWARANYDFEDAAVVDDGNELEAFFTVERGLQGVYTVGLMNSGDEDNFDTIEEAMEMLYFKGITGDIEFQFTDEEYNMGGEEAAWDFRSAIIGLGYNAELDRTFSITWKAAPNRELIKGGVTINLGSVSGYGVRFGQSLENLTSALAPVNTSLDPQYINFPGHVTFDGGDLNALRFVMNSQSELAVPFYLGQGSHDITLKNLIIENADPAGLDRVKLPLKSGDHTNIPFTFDPDRVDINNDIRTFTAGIASRNRLFDFEEIVEDEDFVGVEIDTVLNSNNSFIGNEISNFGYGIVSLGLGGLFKIDSPVSRYVNYNNQNNLYQDNRISNVGRAGIAIGNEENSVVSGNTITDVNPNDISDFGDGAGSYDAAGIMIGGLIYEENSEGDKRKGYHAKDITVDANRVSGVQSDYAATGIKVEQHFILYGVIDTEILELPDGPENVLISNNVIKDITVTDPMARKVGIHLFTQRETDGMDEASLLQQHQAYADYKSRNDKIVNNTIIISGQQGNSEDVVAGIFVQNVEGLESYNNAIAVTDANVVEVNHDLQAAFIMQTPLPENDGPVNDYNAYFIDGNVATVKLIEMNEDDEIEFNFDKDDFENLDQWSIFTGSDENSVEYNFLNDHVVNADDIAIRLVDGRTPLGSKINNRGIRLDYVTNDKDGTSRGVTGERYDIGAIEFRGRLYTTDMEMIRFAEPAAYKATQIDAESGNDFTNSEHIMTTAPVNVVGQVKNDGSLAQSLDVTLSIQVESNTFNGEFNEIASFTKEVTVGSTDDGMVDFETDMGTDPWVPMTYGEYNNDEDDDNDYNVPARYLGMEANVTPRIKLVMSVGSDENNINNEIEKIVRYYIVKSELGIVLSVTDNAENLLSGNIDAVGGALNTTNVRNGMLTGLNWAINNRDGRFDYDLFDRDGWEKRSVDYKPYVLMVWSDGADDTEDVLSRYEKGNVDEFLAQGTDEFKVNMVTASQGLVRESDEEFRRMYLRANYSNPTGNPRGPGVDYLPADPANDPPFTVTGAKVARNFTLGVTNPLTTPADDAYNPRPSVVRPFNGSGPGISQVAATYDNFDQNLFDLAPAAGVAVTTLNYNTIYLGLDWRHISNPGLLMQGVMDYFNQNGGFIIPVELASFEADQVQRGVMLEWATETEVDFSHFIVEKSTDGNLFNGIANVKSKGTSGVRTNYDPVFDEDVRFGETYTYRLKMVDLDGTWSYSDERTVTLSGGDAEFTDVRLTPNPSIDGTATVELRSANRTTVTLEVYDMAGNLLLTQNRDVVNGPNQLDINLGNVANGVYNVIIKTDSFNISKPLTVSK